jgi:ribosomal protein S7
MWYLSIVQKIATTIAASAVKSLRVKSLLDEVPKTAIAREMGVNRATVAKRLKSDDISLGAFIEMSDAIGADPVEVLQQAIQKHQPRRKK